MSMDSSANPATTQRRLILIRHAKAVEEDAGGDHARALAERGLAEAAALGAWLAEQGLKPELALCSTATRTRQTLAALGNNIPTILSDKLYLATTNEMLAQIQAIEDAVHTLAMVCHNPGAHALMALLVDACANPEDEQRMLLKFPTSACAVIDFEVPNWREVLPETGLLTKLRY